MCLISVVVASSLRAAKWVQTGVRTERSIWLGEMVACSTDFPTGNKSSYAFIQLPESVFQISSIPDVLRNGHGGKNAS